MINPAWQKIKTGVQYFKSDNFVAAKQCFDEAIALEPSNAQAHMNLGLTLEKLNDIEGALKSYSKAFDLWKLINSEHQCFALVSIALIHQARTEFAKAEEYLRQAISVTPNHGMANYILGRLFLIQLRFADALPFLFGAEARIAQDNKDLVPFLKTDIGEALRLQEKFHEAEPYYRSALEVSPGFTQALQGIGYICLFTARLDEAIVNFEEVVSLTSSKPEDSIYALGGKAEALRMKSKFYEAEQVCRRALGINEKYASGHHILGMILSGQRRFDEANLELDLALSNDHEPKNQKFFLVSKGDLFRLKDDFAAAESMYREALVIDPNHASALAGVGYVLTSLEKYDEAITNFERADALWAATPTPTKNRKFALRGIATVLRIIGDYDQAASKLELALSIDNEDVDLFIEQGNCLMESGQYTAALEIYSDGINISPDHPYLHHNRADCYFRQANYRHGWWSWHRAIESYEKEFHEDPSFKTVFDKAYNCASLLKDVFQKREDADSLYIGLLKLLPEHIETNLGRAFLYKQWADTHDCNPSIQAQTRYMFDRVNKMLENRYEKYGRFRDALLLTDINLEYGDVSAAKKWITNAEKAGPDTVSKRALLAYRNGVYHLCAKNYEKAIAKFSDYLKIRKADFSVRARIAEALLKLKRYPEAQQLYQQIIKTAPGYVDARLGLAQLCIELADNNDPSMYRVAEVQLTSVIERAEFDEDASKRLYGEQLATVYYLRGYARAKSYEAKIEMHRSDILALAVADFAKCKSLSTNNIAAENAFNQLQPHLQQRKHGQLSESLGSLFVCVAGVFLFLVAQVGYLFTNHPIVTLLKISTISTTSYALMTFGGLVFFISGIYLPKVLKLKVAGVELQKESVAQPHVHLGFGLARPSTVITMGSLEMGSFPINQSAQQFIPPM